jgi:methyl-accepting chemotaxis protein/coenzyme F420-reducing hydrogenase delta subunit
MFSNISINLKFNILLFLSIVSFGAIIYINYYTQKELDNITISRLLASEIETQLQILRRHEQSFFITKKNIYKSNFNKEYINLSKKFKKLKSLLTNINFSQKRVNQFEIYVSNYKKSFYDLIEIRKKIGFSARDGALKVLLITKEKIKAKLEELKGTGHIRENFLMLQIYEQDFITYKELKYAHFFDEKYEMSLDQIKQMSLYLQTRNELNSLFLEYKKNFDNVVKLIGELGINQNTGYRGNSFIAINNLIRYSQNFKDRIYKTVEFQETNLKKNAILISLTLLLFLFILMFFIFTQVKSKLIKLKLYTEKLRNNSRDFRSRIEIISNDEVGIISNNLNTFMSESQLRIKHCQRNFTKIMQNLEEISLLNDRIEKNIGIKETYLKDITNEINTSQLLTEKSLFFARDIEENLENKSQNIKDSQNIASKFTQEVNDSFQITVDLALKMGILKQESSKIEALSDKIDDIADRLNIVALNAAIESSKAGEHGKGFSSIADKIRLLSEESFNILEYINKNVSNIHQVVDELDQQIIKNNGFISRIKDSSLYVKENLDAVETDFSGVYRNSQELYSKNEKSGEKIGNVVAKVGDLNSTISSHRILLVSLLSEIEKISFTQKDTEENVLSFIT